MSWNPYGTGAYDSTTPPGDRSPGSQAAPSGWSAQSGTAPEGAGAHYIPGSPATANRTNVVQRPGMRALAVLLVLASLAYLGWHLTAWGAPLLDSLLLENCPNPDERMSCVTSDAVHRWVYAPLLAVVVSWSFASGAATEAKNGRARGYLHLVCGFAALVVGGLVSSL